MKKIGLPLLLVIFVVISSACGGGTDNDKNTETSIKDTTTQENSNKTKAKEATTAKEKKDTYIEQVSVQVGLGDTLDAFKKQYGENKGNDQMGRFKGDYLLPMFINDRAVDMTIQFESTDQKTRSMEEAKQIASQLIPKDATLEKEYTDDSDLPKKVMLYHSDTLAKLFPDWAPAGKFLVIFGYHEGDENSVFSITIGIGDTP